MKTNPHTAIPHDASRLPPGKHSYSYKNYTFTLEVFQATEARNTNEMAIETMTNNIQASSKKRSLGYGMGQYINPRNLGGFKVSHIELIAHVGTKRYPVPIEIDEAGRYRAKLSRQTSDSLLSASVGVMHNIFSSLGMRDVVQPSAGTATATMSM